MLEAIGDDPDRDGLRDTPKRVAQRYAEISGGTHAEAVDTLSTQFEEDHQEMETYNAKLQELMKRER